MENFAEAKFLNTDNPPVSLRLTAPFTQGGLAAEYHTLINPYNLLINILCAGGPYGRTSHFQ